MTPARIMAIVASLIVIAGGYIYIKQAPGDPQLYTFQFAANESYYEFLHDLGPRSRILVVFNSRDQKKVLYKSQDKRLWSPTPTSNDRMLVSILPQLNTGERSLQEEVDAVESTLMSCDMTSHQCEKLFKFDGSISSALELGSGDILFVGGEPKVVADPFEPDRPFVGYRNANFYVHLNSGEVRKLTSVDAPQISAVSRSKNRFVLEYHPNLLDRPSNRKFTSRIYSATMLDTDDGLKVNIDESSPFISYGKRIDSKPSISPNGNHIAFLSSSGGRGEGWIYSIVIYNLRTRQPVFVISPPKDRPRSLSMPIFVNNVTVRYALFADGVYHLREYSLTKKQTTESGQIPVSAIEIDDAIEIGSE